MASQAMRPTNAMPSTTVDSSAAGTARRAARIEQPTTQRVTETAKETIGQVVDSTKRQADSQRARLASGIDQIADSLRQTGETLTEHDQKLAGEYAQKAAVRVEHAADYLRERNVDEVVRDVQDFARREPALVLGGAFALGFLAARFLKVGGPGGGRITNGG